MSKPEILLAGACPEWAMVELEAKYLVHKLYEAVGRNSFAKEIGGNIRAIATRGELGASAELFRGALTRMLPQKNVAELKAVFGGY